MKSRLIEKVVTKTTLKDQETDFAYWQTRSYAERLEALEAIRAEYNNWKYKNVGQGLQRVYRVAKLKQG